MSQHEPLPDEVKMEVTTQTVEIKEAPKPKQRLVSLDVFRGFTIWLMVFVNNCGSCWSWIDHAPWDGIHLADFVMPFFLFIVGMSVSLSMSKMVETRSSSKKEIFKKIAERAIKLVLLGWFLGSSRFAYDLSKIRIPGVLQRIGFDYFVVSITMLFAPMVDMNKVDLRIETINKSYLRQIARVLFGSKGVFSVFIRYIVTWSVAVAIFIVYMMLIFAYDVPGCGRGSLTSSCNAAGYIDELILTPSHMYCCPTCHEDTPPCKYFDPEGLVSTIASTASCFIGLYMGYILAKFSDHKHRLAHWTVSGSVMVVLGIIVHFSGIPFNKNLYSLSYVLLMAGSACILFSVSYAIIDIPQTNIIRKILIPLIALGMNSIAVYAFDHFWNTTFGKYLYYGEEGLTLWHYIYKYVFAWMGTQTGSFFWALSDSLCNTIFALILYKLGIFFKI